MTYKFPGAGADVARGALGDIIEGRSMGDTAAGAVTKSGKIAMTSILTGGQRTLDGITSKMERKIGIGLGRASIGQVLNDPVGALGSIIGSGNLGLYDSKGGWYPLLLNRPDPLLEIDWVPSFPFNLPAEYVEEIQWSHPRLTASTGVFRYGSYIYTVEGMETSPITVTLYEDRLMTATNWLYTWRAQQYDDRKKVFGYPAAYKKNIRALMKDVAGTVVGQVVFTGCFPTTFPQVNMAAEGSSRVRLQVEFSCDSITFEGYGGGVLASLTQSWEKIINDGVGGIANAAFGRITASMQPITNAIDGAIRGAKSTVSGAFGSMASAIRF
jgi:hypothetical protein